MLSHDASQSLIDMATALSTPRRAGPTGATPRFGRTVREAREARGLGLRKFADRIGLSATYVSQVERGRAWPPPPAAEKVVAMAQELDQDPDELLALAGRVAPDLTQVIRAQPRHVAALLRAIADLPPEEIDRLTKAARRRAARQQ